MSDAPDTVALQHHLKAATAAMKWAIRSEAAPRIKAAIDLAKSESGIPILPSQMDSDPWLFNCLNGTIELKTGKLREHRREDYITKISPVVFDAQATCPLWDKFLYRIFDGNADVIEYLQRAAGYSMTGTVTEQCLFFLHGGGANGKSTFLGALLELLGDYGMQSVSELLMAKNNESHPTERADLFGKRLVATIETDDGKRMAESLMKQLTGGDKIRARRMREDFWEFSPTWKIWLAANHKPQIRGTDHAVWRRIKLVPFDVTISDEEKDPHLPEKLKAELPGILAWAIRGCLAWQKYGLGEPDEVRTAVAEYRSEQDVFGQFISERCFVNREVSVESSSLFVAFKEWCQQNGEHEPTQRSMASSLKSSGCVQIRGTHGVRMWRGIGLCQVVG